MKSIEQLGTEISKIDKIETRLFFVQNLDYEYYEVRDLLLDKNSKPLGYMNSSLLHAISKDILINNIHMLQEVFSKPIIVVKE